MGEKREREREGGIGVPIRKERKVKRVMGCALSRQLSWPGVGLMSAMAGSVRAMRWVLGLSTGIDTDGMFTIVRHVGERTRFVKSPAVQGSSVRAAPSSNCDTLQIHVYNK